MPPTERLRSSPVCLPPTAVRCRRRRSVRSGVKFFRGAGRSSGRCRSRSWGLGRRSRTKRRSSTSGAAPRTRPRGRSPMSSRASGPRGSSTAAAAEQAAGDVTIAAIASDLAAELYGVRVLRPRIEDNPHNATRFLVIGRRAVGPSARDKTSILFAMRNEPGVLYRILEPFARRGINLIKIETRPAKSRPWEFVTFLDFEGHRDTPTVAAALNEIEGRTLFLKVLGSYPAA